jgi:tetratricopeptide (TPR) repeat protein
MKHLVWLVGIVVLIQTTGCASLFTSRGNANDRIEHWLSQKEYGKALAVVADLKASPSPATSNLQEIQEKINTQIASYEQQVIAKAEEAAAINDWGTAFDVYREALPRVPDSQRLQRGQQRLLQRHAEHLDRLELERLIAKGEWTLKDLEVSRLAEANNAGGWLGQYLLSRKISSAHELALEMAGHGKRALERKDLTLARRILAVALNLLNAVQSPALSTRLQETLKEEARILGEQQRVAKAQSATQGMPSEPPNENGRSELTGQEQKDTKRLMADLRRACREKDFVEAQQLMSELESRGVETQELHKLSKQLAGDVARHVKHLIEIGATHYSQQRYENAMDVWKQAQVLDPNNEQLTARIKRVTRVLDKLQTLRNKNSATK